MKINLSKVSLAILLTSATTLASAGGFQLWEQDGAGIGDYHAGAAADTNNAGIEFYNPAGMVFMKRKKLQVSTGAAVIPLKARFNGIVRLDGIGVSTNGWRKGDTTNAVPNFHLVDPISDKFAVGLGVTVPFGLATDYAYQSPLDDAATRTRVMTVNVNPNAAYKITPWLSVGGGIDFQYAEADFDDAVPLLQEHDTAHLTSFGVGYNVGIFTHSQKGTDIGLSYRSGITQRANGINKSGTRTPSSIFATLPLPGTFYSSIVQHINKRWSVMASADYTLWSSLKTLTLNNMINPLGGHFSVIAPFQYHDSWNFAIGSNYWLTHKLMWKIGGGYDQTPTNNADRDIRLPGVDRFTASTGFRYLMNKRITMDAGWIHFFPISVARINSNGPSGTGIVVNTDGIAKMNADVIGGQLTFYFDK